MLVVVLGVVAGVVVVVSGGGGGASLGVVAHDGRRGMELCSWLEEKRSDFRFSFFAFRLVHINTGAPSATLPRSDRRNSQRSLAT